MTRKPTTPQKAPSLEDQIYDALRTRGWIIPQTDEDVMRTEVDIEHNPIPLPPELEDPSELLRKLFPVTRRESQSPHTSKSAVRSPEKQLRYSATVPPGMFSGSYRVETECHREYTRGHPHFPL